MDEWLTESLVFFRKNLNIDKVNYKDLIVVIYEDYSNRNLAKMIANLYDLDEIGVYFEIDSILANSNDKNQNLKSVKEELIKKGYWKWQENSEFK